MYNGRSVFGYSSKQERERDKVRDVSPTVLIITRIDMNFPLLCFPGNARAKNILWLMGSPSPFCGDKHAELHTPRALCASFNPFSHYIIYTDTYMYIFHHIARRLFYYYYYIDLIILSVPSPPSVVSVRINLRGWRLCRRTTHLSPTGKHLFRIIFRRRRSDLII